MNSKLKALIITILFASFVKYFFQAIVLSPFEIDQEFLSLEAWNIIKDKNFTLIGAPTSVGGIFIGPFYTYLVTIFMILTNFNPYSVNILSALFAFSIPLLTYVFATKLFNKSTGIIAAILSTISISFLSLLNIPPLVIPLALVSLIVFYATSQLKTRPRALKYAALFSGLGLNLHFTAIYLPIIIIAWMIFNKIKTSKAIAKRSIYIFFLPLSPLFLFELRNRFFILRNFISFISTSNSFNQTFLTRLLASLKLFLASSGELLVFHKELNLIVGLLVLSLFLLKVVKDRDDFNIKLIAFWLLASVLLNGLYSGQLLPYYFLIVHPIFFIATAVVLHSLCQSKSKYLIYAILIALTIRTATWFPKRYNGYSLNFKRQAFEHILKNNQPQDVNLSLNTQYSRRGGLEFLRRYYGFDKKILETRPTYSIIAPRNWHRMKTDVNYGEFGVINP